MYAYTIDRFQFYSRSSKHNTVETVVSQDSFQFYSRSSYTSMLVGARATNASAFNSIVDHPRKDPIGITNTKKRLSIL